MKRIGFALAFIVGVPTALVATAMKRGWRPRRARLKPDARTLALAETLYRAYADALGISVTWAELNAVGRNAWAAVATASAEAA